LPVSIHCVASFYIYPVVYAAGEPNKFFALPPAPAAGIVAIARMGGAFLGAKKAPAPFLYFALLR